MLIKLENFKQKWLSVYRSTDIAAKLGKNREEFHLDHLHVFSKSSLLYLSRQLKLKKLNIKA